MTTFKTSTESAREIVADLLIVPVFVDAESAPGLRETGLADTYKAARLTGKKGETLLVTRRRGDRFAADAVLLVGVGPRRTSISRRCARTLAKALAGARRFPKVATTFAQAFPARQARRRRAGRRRGDRSGRLPVRPLQETGATSRTSRARRSWSRAAGTPRRCRRPRKAGRDRRRRGLLGTRPREHAGGRSAAGRDRQAGAGDGEGGRPDLQGLDRGAAQAGRLRRDPRRGPGIGEPATHDRAALHGGRQGRADRAVGQGHRLRLGRSVHQGRRRAWRR